MALFVLKRKKKVKAYCLLTRKKRQFLFCGVNIEVNLTCLKKENLFDVAMLRHRLKNMALVGVALDCYST